MTDLHTLSDTELLKRYHSTEQDIAALNNLQMAVKIAMNSLD